MALNLHTDHLEESAKAKRLFYEAMELQGDARQDFIDQRCGGDESLRRSVMRLFASFDAADDRLESPAFSNGDLLAELDITPPSRVDTEADHAQILALRTNLETLLEPSDREACLGLIDEYEVIKKIGEGGMGVVFRARDPKLQRDVAIKVLAPELAIHERSRDDFLREARALAAIKNPHVVQVFAVNEFKGMPYLVMEFIEGVTLADRIKSATHLSMDEVTRIANEIATGLAAVHTQGMTHRDIKPANVMLETDSGNVKITDFGLAHHSSADQQTSRPHGTPWFISPEQATGEAVDARSDLFSLGSVFFAMCTGKSPFQAETTTNTISRVCNHRPPNLRSVNPSVPVWFGHVISKLLEKDPDKRIQSAEELLRLLAVNIERKRSRLTMIALGGFVAACVALLAFAAAEWQGWTNVTGWFNKSPMADTPDGTQGSKDQLHVNQQPTHSGSQTQAADAEIHRNLTAIDILPNDEWAWSEPKIVRNTSGRGALTISPCLAGDGLALYYSRFSFKEKERQRDVWVCRRIATGAPFGEPAPLEGLVNTTASEGGVAVSNDELTLIVTSDREGGMGENDLWIAQRPEVHQPWPALQSMGEQINTEGNEISPWLSYDGLVLLFSREQSIYISKRAATNDSFGRAKPLQINVNLSNKHNAAWMSRDRLSLVITARRQSTTAVGAYDMWLFTRDVVNGEFGNPTNLGEPLNSEKIDGHPTFSPDGRTVYFHSQREGSTSIFESRRVRRK